MIKIFNAKLYLKQFTVLFLTYLLAEGIFSWIFIPDSFIRGMYEKILSIGIYGFVLLSFPNLKREEKIFTGLFTLLMIKLLFESIFKYDAVFKQLTLFTVIYPVIYTVFVRYILRKFDVDLLEFIAKFYLVTYILFMIIYGRSFSFGLQSVDMEDYGPFSGDSRIIHARSIFMMIIPCLWFLNRYMVTRKVGALVIFLFCILIIVVHQHRSVWSSALVAIALYFLLSIRSHQHRFKQLINFGVFAFFAAVFGYVLVSIVFPSSLDMLSDRFSEIFDPAKEGSTGNFRIEQSLVYGEFIAQKPVFGWSFEGFTLRNPLVDWWDENTGHHFHEGFVEILFYHGIVGLLLKYSFILLILWRAFTRKLSDASIILSSFCISGLIFSLSYVLPLVFWGHTGMCFYYLDKATRRQTA